MNTKQFKLNLPIEIKEWIEMRAILSDRSQGREIVRILRKEMAAETEIGVLSSAAPSQTNK